jgi:hypothetical protein
MLPDGIAWPEGKTQAWPDGARWPDGVTGREGCLEWGWDVPPGSP